MDPHAENYASQSGEQAGLPTDTITVEQEVFVDIPFESPYADSDDPTIEQDYLAALVHWTRQLDIFRHYAPKKFLSLASNGFFATSELLEESELLDIVQEDEKGNVCLKDAFELGYKEAMDLMAREPGAGSDPDPPPVPVENKNNGPAPPNEPDESEEDIPNPSTRRARLHRRLKELEQKSARGIGGPQPAGPQPAGPQPLAGPGTELQLRVQGLTLVPPVPQSPPTGPTAEHIRQQEIDTWVAKVKEIKIDYYAQGIPMSVVNATFKAAVRALCDATFVKGQSNKPFKIHPKHAHELVTQLAYMPLRYGVDVCNHLLAKIKDQQNGKIGKYAMAQAQLASRRDAPALVRRANFTGSAILSYERIDLYGSLEKAMHNIRQAHYGHFVESIRSAMESGEVHEFAVRQFCIARGLSRIMPPADGSADYRTPQELQQYLKIKQQVSRHAYFENQIGQEALNLVLFGSTEVNSLNNYKNMRNNARLRQTIANEAGPAISFLLPGIMDHPGETKRIGIVTLLAQAGLGPTEQSLPAAVKIIMDTCPHVKHFINLVGAVVYPSFLNGHRDTISALPAQPRGFCQTLIAPFRSRQTDEDLARLSNINRLYRVTRDKINDGEDEGTIQVSDLMDTEDTVDYNKVRASQYTDHTGGDSDAMGDA